MPNEPAEALCCMEVLCSSVSATHQARYLATYFMPWARRQSSRQPETNKEGGRSARHPASSQRSIVCTPEKPAGLLLPTTRDDSPPPSRPGDICRPLREGESSYHQIISKLHPFQGFKAPSMTLADYPGSCVRTSSREGQISTSNILVRESPVDSILTIVWQQYERHQTQSHPLLRSHVYCSTADLNKPFGLRLGYSVPEQGQGDERWVPWLVLSLHWPVTPKSITVAGAMGEELKDGTLPVR
ncbi:hypothetical protein MGYG_04962 [Nannizzia gypsea CBS 118893]|uniref:Uncharacterized protein n=1 Tax=Arthroderma gypseum (strain ATCC MYA-4604 / CBS 118893) TaxID=535722 RepID=E4UXR6_ARTGP|nr:hypothetical protein MGYG_04962 [Nannizzia gypsea CBS 118893]EFR01961.1 hypothetical protein MGYG_04962 [Nannizzia gypsea CBS 118893]